MCTVFTKYIMSVNMSLFISSVLLLEFFPNNEYMRSLLLLEFFARQAVVTCISLFVLTWLIMWKLFYLISQEFNYLMLIVINRISWYENLLLAIFRKAINSLKIREYIKGVYMLYLRWASIGLYDVLVFLLLLSIAGFYLLPIEVELATTFDGSNIAQLALGSLFPIDRRKERDKQKTIDPISQQDILKHQLRKSYFRSFKKEYFLKDAGKYTTRVVFMTRNMDDFEDPNIIAQIKRFISNRKKKPIYYYFTTYVPINKANDIADVIRSVSLPKDMSSVKQTMILLDAMERSRYIKEVNYDLYKLPEYLRKRCVTGYILPQTKVEDLDKHSRIYINFEYINLMPVYEQTLYNYVLTATNDYSTQSKYCDIYNMVFLAHFVIGTYHYALQKDIISNWINLEKKDRKVVLNTLFISFIRSVAKFVVHLDGDRISFSRYRLNRSKLVPIRERFLNNITGIGHLYNVLHDLEAYDHDKTRFLKDFVDYIILSIKKAYSGETLFSVQDDLLSRYIFYDNIADIKKAKLNPPYCRFINKTTDTSEKKVLFANLNFEIATMFGAICEVPNKDKAFYLMQEQAKLIMQAIAEFEKGFSLGKLEGLVYNASFEVWKHFRDHVKSHVIRSEAPYNSHDLSYTKTLQDYYDTCIKYKPNKDILKHQFTDEDMLYMGLYIGLKKDRTGTEASLMHKEQQEIMAMPGHKKLLWRYNHGWGSIIKKDIYPKPVSFNRKKHKADMEEPNVLYSRIKHIQLLRKDPYDYSFFEDRYKSFIHRVSVKEQRLSQMEKDRYTKSIDSGYNDPRSFSNFMLFDMYGRVLSAHAQNESNNTILDQQYVIFHFLIWLNDSYKINLSKSQEFVPCEKLLDFFFEWVLDHAVIPSIRNLYIHPENKGLFIYDLIRYPRLLSFTKKWPYCASSSTLKDYRDWTQIKDKEHESAFKMEKTIIKVENHQKDDVIKDSVTHGQVSTQVESQEIAFLPPPQIDHNEVLNDSQEDPKEDKDIKSLPTAQDYMEKITLYYSDHIGCDESQATGLFELYFFQMLAFPPKRNKTIFNLWLLSTKDKYYETYCAYLEGPLYRQIKHTVIEDENITTSFEHIRRRFSLSEDYFESRLDNLVIEPPKLMLPSHILMCKRGFEDYFKNKFRFNKTFSHEINDLIKYGNSLYIKKPTEWVSRFQQYKNHPHYGLYLNHRHNCIPNEYINHLHTTVKKVKEENDIAYYYMDAHFLQSLNEDMAIVDIYLDHEYPGQFSLLKEHIATIDNIHKTTRFVYFGDNKVWRDIANQVCNAAYRIQRQMIASLQKVRETAIESGVGVRSTYTLLLNTIMDSFNLIYELSKHYCYFDKIINNVTYVISPELDTIINEVQIKPIFETLKGLANKGDLNTNPPVTKHDNSDLNDGDANTPQ